MSTATMTAVNLGNRSLLLGNSGALLFLTVDALLSLAPYPGLKVFAQLSHTPLFQVES